MSQGLYLHNLEWGVAAEAVARELDQPHAVVIEHAVYEPPAAQVEHHDQAVAAESGLLDDDTPATERRGGGAW